MDDAILFSSRDGYLQVLDIPRSIGNAQHIQGRDDTQRQLYSTPAPDTPYPSLEPKSEKARANVLARIDHETRALHERYASFIRCQLDSLKQVYNGPWHAPRISNIDKDTSPQCEDTPMSDEHTEAMGRLSIQTFGTSKPNNKDKKTSRVASIQQQSIFQNPKNEIRLVQQINVTDIEAEYLMPPQSIVFQDVIKPSAVSTFLTNIIRIYSEPSSTAPPGQFDIVLMDPPWSNRSVSRGNRYSTFRGKGREFDALSMIADALPTILAPDGLLAIWITNSAISRLRAFEIFDDIGIDAVEEWIWLKVTTNGEPVYDLDGLYRHPWEVCIVGRRGTPDQEVKSPKSRLIIACPDMHSRKPAIGKMLAAHYDAEHHQDLRKLEIFARYGSAGWCAWGDEALKYNNSKYWHSIHELNSASKAVLD